MQIWTPNVDNTKAFPISIYIPKHGSQKVTCEINGSIENLPPFLFLDKCWLWPKTIYKIGLVEFRELLVMDNHNYGYLKEFLNVPFAALRLKYGKLVEPITLSTMVIQDPNTVIPPLIGVLK